ncbi:MAG: hypothetical protein HKN50_02915 [Gammaproteobacteria bacterium]|nr:hypothetical protein [Gammaproteobacteria bacterium]
MSTAHAAVTASVDVTSVSVGGGGDVFVRASGAFVNPNNCTNGSRYLLPRDHGAKKELLAILLTASASGMQVVLGVLNTSCTTIGGQTYATIFNIEVK